MYASQIFSDGHWHQLTSRSSDTVENEEAVARDWIRVLSPGQIVNVVRIVDTDRLTVEKVFGGLSPPEMAQRQKGTIVWVDGRPDSDKQGLTVERSADGLVVLDHDLPASYVADDYVPFPGTVIYGDGYHISASEDPKPFCPPKWAEKRSREAKMELLQEPPKCREEQAETDPLPTEDDPPADCAHCEAKICGICPIPLVICGIVAVIAALAWLISR